MNFLVIIILFSGIYGLDKEELPGIDVLKTLKEKKISCDFHNFVHSTDNSNDEYDVLMDDLKRYCSTSKTTKQYHVICHMVLIEFEIGCLLPNKSRPYPIKYTTSSTATQICSMNKISFTNIWIWKKLTSDEREQMGSTTSQLCPKLTESNDTLRLTRLFYKLAPRIRRADIIFQTDKPSLELSVDKIPAREETNKTLKDGLLVDKPKVIIENKTELVLDLKKKPSLLKKKIHSHKNDDDGNLIYSNDDQADFDVEHHQVGEEDPNQRAGGDVRNLDVKGMRSANRTKTKKHGSPLGRAGEKPDREQINERPKPKPLDVETVFKSNDRKELRNWVEGKKGENQPDKDVAGVINRFHRLKSEENPSAPRKRHSLRSRLSRYTGNDRSWSNHLITSFLIFTLFIVVIYLILNNRNKVLGLIIEGCRRNRIFQERRPASRLHTRLSQSI